MSIGFVGQVRIVGTDDKMEGLVGSLGLVG